MRIQVKKSHPQKSCNYIKVKKPLLGAWFMLITRIGANQEWQSENKLPAKHMQQSNHPLFTIPCSFHNDKVINIIALKIVNGKLLRRSGIYLIRKARRQAIVD